MDPAEPAQADGMSFGAQEFPFDLQVAAVTAKCPAGANDAVTRRSRVSAFAQDAPDGAMRSW